MAAVSFPLLFAALTGRSGHGLAPYGPDSLTYPLGLYSEKPSRTCLSVSMFSEPSTTLELVAT